MGGHDITHPCWASMLIERVKKAMTVKAEKGINLLLKPVVTSFLIKDILNSSIVATALGSLLWDGTTYILRFFIN